MKRSCKPLLIAAVLAAASLAAQAQPGPGGPGGPGGAGPGMGPGAMMHPGMGPGHMDPARMQARWDKRMTEFKQVLQITPAQEGAWTAFTAALKPPADMKRPDPAEMDKLTTPERIDRMRALRAQHQAVQDKRADATKTFYAQLTPEQKKSFDVISARMMKRGFGGGMGGHGMHMRG